MGIINDIAVDLGLRKKKKEIEVPSGLLVDDILDEARAKKGLLGEAVVSPALIDQRTSINPVTLEGQSEIIYNVWLYRSAKWHWNVYKADEFIAVTPAAPPAFVPLMSQKERLEGRIKSGMASAAQAVADYELLKHDLRKYRDILDFFKKAENESDEHVLRSLFVDRVDAYTGEGYSMITMAKRWPTIISDFIRMPTKLDSPEEIMKEVKVSKAEAVVLRTKNELYKEWKKLFFPDVKERYARIRNLLQSRERSIDQYREWLKPIVSLYKQIREQEEIQVPSANLHNPLVFANTPQGYVYAKLWMYKPIMPEEMAKPIILQGQGYELDPYDDWVKKKCKILEKKYNVRIYHDKADMKKRENKEGHNPYYIVARDFIKKIRMTGARDKKGEILGAHPGPIFDERFAYYAFVDIDYECQYKKGSSGPMVMEDQYFHIYPFILSKNVMLLFHMEMAVKEKAFDREVEELIGLSKVEKGFLKSIEDEFKKEEEAVRRLESLFKFKKKTVKTGESFGGWLKGMFMPLRYYFLKPGPYEHTVRERINKTFGDYFGPQVAELNELIKETCYRLSGVGP
ncbi:MAG: hypothetical protein JW754_00130 [Candidatus Aenigmarchaeota archaeon]|nr:hypothetical protein [Candidatus Aenigmarchaeota archaeon]